MFTSAQEVLLRPNGKKLGAWLKDELAGRAGYETSEYDINPKK